MKRIDKILATTTRQQRYRLSGKLLKLKVYQIIEVLVVALFLVAVIVAFVGGKGVIVNGIGVLVVVLAIGHYLRVAAEKPWLVMMAAFEAFVVWAAYTWWLSGYVSIPHFSVLCVFIFTIIFWMRGEREVKIAALETLLSQDSYSRGSERSS